MALKLSLAGGSHLRRLGWICLYVVWTSTVVLGGLELAARFGLPEGRTYRVRNLIATAGGGPRWLVLGDSFSVDAPENFGDRLKRRLAENGVKTLNLAVNGFGPEDYLRMLELYGADVRPEVILTCIFIGNDTGDTLYRMDGLGSRFPFLRRLVERSYAGSVLLDARSLAISRWRLARIGSVAAGSANPPPADVGLFLVELAREHPDHFRTNLLLETPEARSAWKRNIEVLLEINRLSQEMHSRLVVAIFPDVLQIDDSHDDLYSKLGFHLDPGFRTTAIPQTELLETCREAAIDCVDLLPAFRAARGSPLYLPHDLHWSAQGVHLAVETVWNSLRPMLVR